MISKIFLAFILLSSLAVAEEEDHGFVVQEQTPVTKQLSAHDYNAPKGKTTRELAHRVLFADPYRGLEKAFDNIMEGLSKDEMIVYRDAVKSYRADCVTAAAKYRADAAVLEKEGDPVSLANAREKRRLAGLLDTHYLPRLDAFLAYLRRRGIATE